MVLRNKIQSSKYTFILKKIKHAHTRIHTKPLKGRK